MDRIQYQIFKIILSIFKKEHGEHIDKPPGQIYVNKIENRVIFKIKNGHSLELLITETMKLLGSSASSRNYRGSFSSLQYCQ